MPERVILCVDDEKIVLESLRSELELHLPEEYQLEFAESGEEAMEVMEEIFASGDELALIISDYIMPGMTGDEVLSYAYTRCPQALQIMLTGQASLQGVTNAINQAHLFRYIEKPWEKNDLLISIREALKSFEQSKQLAAYQSSLEQKIAQRTQELEQTLQTLQKSQQQLVLTEKMAVLGGLVAGVAHEINTPVGVCISAASALESKVKEISRLYREDALTEEKYQGFMQDAEQGTAILLRNLKNAARLVTSFKLVAVDQSSEAMRKFELNEYLASILLSLQPELKKHRVEVTQHCPELSLYSYPGDFSQIFTNLIMNSIAHGFAEQETHRAIHIQVQLIQRELVINYADNGKGIAPELKRKIFEPFFTTNRQAGGSGLGLHIIYNIVTQRLQGTITCEAGPEPGACFVIRMPYHSGE